MRFARSTVLALSMLLAACSMKSSDAPHGPSGCGDCDAARSPDAGTQPDSTPSAVGTLRTNLMANLLGQMNTSSVLFGQQRFNITGANADGTEWFATETSLDTSDAKTVTGEHPAMMGFDVYDLAVKPSDWVPSSQVDADAAKFVYAAGGVVTMTWHMYGCADTTSFDAAGNEACLCQLANDDAYAKSWLIANYKIFADALQTYGLDQIPIIFRPLHEMNGNWFWWGAQYWTCASYVANPRFTGADAYARVFREIVTYLRVDRGLDNLLIAYSPGATTSLTTEADYLDGYPGDSYVDVLGEDVYYGSSPDFGTQTAAYATLLQMVTTTARAHNKVAALTETGNDELSSETTPASATWFSSQLLPLIQSSGVNLAYALTWENRTSGSEQFWVPYAGTPGVADFQAFEQSAATTFLPEVPKLYAAPTTGYAVCASCASADSNGDGWGWEDNASCVVGSWCLAPQYPSCKLCADGDANGDGWGWENGASCILDATCQ